MHEPFKGAQSPLKYILVPKESDRSIPEGYTKIETPINRLACSSTTHLAAFELLGETEKVVAFPNTEYIYSSTFRERVDGGSIQEIGPEISLNIEKILDIRPDLFVGYSVNGQLGQYEKLEQAGIPVFLNSEYLEETPLGRAEWIKVMGLLTNSSDIADSVFRYIESQYLETVESAANKEKSPSVISGMVYQGTWYMPGGKAGRQSFSRMPMLTSCGLDSPESGSIPLSFEAVLEKGLDAEYWIGPSSISSYNEMLALDERYSNFKAFGNRKIYNYNKRVLSQGGNDYFEMAIMRPDLVLGDLVEIFHSENPDPEKLTFFKELTEN